MINYFRGWKRKAGIVTLVLACVCMVGWVRSLSTADIVCFWNRSESVDLLVSADGEIVWQRTFDTDPTRNSVFPLWISSRLHSDIAYDDTDTPNWTWHLWGFGVGEFEEGEIHAAFCAIPYWSIFAALILASGWKLLAKPRRSKPTQYREPEPQNSTIVTRDYFKLWRRKLGVLLLLLSSVFTAAWVRSQIVSDCLRLTILNHHQEIISLNGQLYWWIWPYETDRESDFGGSKDATVERMNADREFSASNPYRIAYVQGRRLQAARLRRYFFSECALPYWSIVLPMTLFSAYLLLSKPRTQPPLSRRPGSE